MANNARERWQLEEYCILFITYKTVLLEHRKGFVFTCSGVTKRSLVNINCGAFDCIFIFTIKNFKIMSNDILFNKLL